MDTLTKTLMYGRNELNKLIRANPGVPVIPWILSELSDDIKLGQDSCGIIKGCEMGRYIEIPSNEGEFHFEARSLYDDPDEVYKYEVVEAIKGADVASAMTDDEIDTAWRNLEWRKAILLYIDA